MRDTLRLPLRPGVLIFAVLALVRVFAGAALLWLLGAPAWAIAAWLLFHVRVSLDLSKLRGGV